jgi:HPt (histidine-containing phosphotransfer) domain-containing protein
VVSDAGCDWWRGLSVGATADAIDSSTLDALRSVDPSGGATLVPAVLRVFLESADANLHAVQEAFRARDSAQLSRAAHAMTSSCGNIGANTLARLYKGIEIASREGRVEAAHPLIAELTREHLRVVIRIREILGDAA